MPKIYIGIDNGVSGAIGIITPDGASITATPVKKVLNYTKEKAWVNRLDVVKLTELLARQKVEGNDIVVGLERPMINPKRWKASCSAIRCMEATMIVLEGLQLPYEWLDSKQWQKIMLPKGLEGDELKTASLDVGKRLFPLLADSFKKDADSILIAEFLKQRDRVKEI